MSKLAAHLHSAGVKSKASAVLAAVRMGHREIDEIALQSGLAPTTVIRVSGILCDLGLIGKMDGSDRIKLLPIFQPSASLD